MDQYDFYRIVDEEADRVSPKMTKETLDRILKKNGLRVGHMRMDRHLDDAWRVWPVQDN
jgi:hypothetical protein